MYSSISRDRKWTRLLVSSSVFGPRRRRIPNNQYPIAAYALNDRLVAAAVKRNRTSNNHCSGVPDFMPSVFIYNIYFVRLASPLFRARRQMISSPSAGVSKTICVHAEGQKSNKEFPVFSPPLSFAPFVISRTRAPPSPVARRIVGRARTYAPAVFGNNYYSCRPAVCY